MTYGPGSSPDSPIDATAGWIAGHIAAYEADDDHYPTMDNGAPLLLLTTKGAKSGLWRRTVLIYGEHDGAYLLVASQGGAPKHPSWYLNLVEHPEVQLRVNERTFRAVARTATPKEKPALWNAMVAIWPSYADYQKKTERDIPLVIVEPIAE
jgi:F420H(2)-dependent quinone reductase